ncbi:MAG: leucine-rich repeat domain-containing protein [Eubacteriales bacterium]
MIKTFKKSISFFAVISILVLIVFSFGGCDKSVGNLQYRSTSGGFMVTHCFNKSGETVIDIPAEINGKPVVEVADFGVVNADQAITIKICKNIKKIGKWAFTNNQNLKEFTVDKDNPWFTAADGVLYSKDMKTLLFYPPAKDVMGSEKELVSFDIPTGVETIRSKAFYKCGKLNKITIPAGVKMIEEKAFCYDEALGNFTLPEGLLKIEKDAFSFCSALTAAEIPSTVRYIGDFAFYNDQNIKSFKVNTTEEFTAKWGKKWYPTQNSDNLAGLIIEYSKPGV